MSLNKFAKAKPETKSSSNDKQTHRVPTNVAAAINEYVRAKAELDAAKAKMESNEEIVKQHGFGIAAETLGKEIEFESFILASQENGLLYIIQDKFAKLDSKKAKAVSDMLGAEAVSEKVTYSFNDEVLQRHGDKIAAMIEKLDIPDEDKEAMLTSTTTWHYNFGLNGIGKVAKDKGLKAAQVLEIVKPVQQLKVRGEK